MPPDRQMPIRKSVRRRRLGSVIQDMICTASRLLCHADRLMSALCHRNPWRPVREHVYARFLTTGRRGLDPSRRRADAASHSTAAARTSR